MTVEIVWEERGPVFTIAGATYFDELRAAEDEFYKDPRSDSAKQKILDLRNMESLDLTADELAVLAAFHIGQSKSSPGIKFAIIAPRGRFDDVVDSFAQLMEVSAWTTRRFQTEEDARAWLSVQTA